MATYDEVAVVRSGNVDGSSTADSRSARQFAVSCWCFRAVLIFMIPMMIVARVRTTPTTPKAMGIVMVSTVLDSWLELSSGSTLGLRFVQDINVDDEFVNMTG